MAEQRAALLQLGDHHCASIMSTWSQTGPLLSFISVREVYRAWTNFGHDRSPGSFRIPGVGWLDAFFAYSLVIEIFCRGILPFCEIAVVLCPAVTAGSSSIHISGLVFLSSLTFVFSLLIFLLTV
jgi:hypothetical protein